MSTLFLSTGTLKLVNVTTGKSDIDATSTIKEGREIIDELRKRNFTVVENIGRRETKSSRKASEIANKLKEQADNIRERADVFDNTFEELLQAFVNNADESKITKEKSGNASALLNFTKKVDWKV
jgi:hypothetical protein